MWCQKWYNIGIAKKNIYYVSGAYYVPNDIPDDGNRAEQWIRQNKVSVNAIIKTQG